MDNNVRQQLISQLDHEIEVLLKDIPFFEQFQGPMAERYRNEFVPLLKEGLRICREQRFDLLTVGELKKRY